MEHIPGRQVIAPCQLGPAGGFRMALGLHEPCALISELKSRRRVDGIVNTAVAWNKAPQQGGVVRVHNGVRPQAGDIPCQSTKRGSPAVGGSASPSTTPFSSRSAERGRPAPSESPGPEAWAAGDSSGNGAAAAGRHHRPETPLPAPGTPASPPAGRRSKTPVVPFDSH